MAEVLEDEELSLRRWHFRYFRKLGFERHQAEILHLAGVDPHDAELLIERGCPHEEALEILT